MKLLKFGGTSVGSAESIKTVADIVASYHRNQVRCAVVVSAMSGVTDKLILISEKAASGDESYLELLKDLEKHHFDTTRTLINVHAQSRVFAFLKTLINELDDLLHGAFLLRERSPRTLDLVLSFGERLSAYLISQYMKELGIDAQFLDARQLVRTDANFNAAKVDFDTTNHSIVEYFATNKALQIITGFIAATEENETTTMGRGGSDYTASIFGAALNAEEVEIWTDVDGVMTADPRQVKNAFSLEAISYLEAMEMSHFGAKVIYPPTIQPLLNLNIPLRIRNTFNREFPGTLISRNPYAATSPPSGNEKLLAVKGISSIKEVALLSLQGSGMIGIPGISSRLFGALARRKINIIIITQASSEHSITFAVSPTDAKYAQHAIDEEFSGEIDAGKVDKAIAETHLSIVAIIGENMRQTPGISGKLFSALGRNGINVRAIAQGSSEVNLTVVISQRNLSKALNTVHEAFFLSETKTLNVFMAGLGLIGSTLLKQIAQQADYLYDNRLLKINFIGIINSRKMLLNVNGIDRTHWNSLLEEEGKVSDMGIFVRQIKELNLPNSVFIDCTSSEDVIKYYQEILQSAISIITPNKLANSGTYKSYLQLKQTALRSGVKFLYETNVGAGLPVIRVLQDLNDSGDKIFKVEGVLSGTLSYIFNSFQEGRKFSEVVKEAQQKGYTEPDPREDLNGMDVARKILILAREVGLSLEPEDVKIESILPQECLDAPNVDAFFKSLEDVDEHMEKRRKEAASTGCKLRFIAMLEDNKASVKLQEVRENHPFYALSGSDNIISYHTARYKERPLVVKGPGAGAEVTAAGVFAELISISNFLYQ
ncbi:bifunctional aspartate kinase/homoserine dehydrogenase I [Catalinimonas niigatensis]|uniref:bifunctional aspartate kinase/homoserine dehydrogenase I n=1 Tax=Catalinimonas niigatensis TaxID=1397264 RepID=UPI002666314E|nr:bifunctional aspartate kinase/homoserine dehydrogenase I [Catalinimonas niigatensis]WPP48071.1 bifunctional aspartate kinase/homoserine dehydrogenase I [Catalinimonas niigatensis]